MLSPIFSTQSFISANASDSNPTILSASPPSLKTAYSPGVRALRVGDEVVVATAFTNNDVVYNWSAYFIVEVRDANGVSILLDWQSGVVKAGSQVEVGISWSPLQAGAYQLRTFAISGFDNPAILSSISSSQVTIASAPGSYLLLIGNRTFDIQYSFSSADGIVQSMKVAVPAPAIIANVNVANDTAFEIVLPRKMLERMEIESGFHYCVGNSFAAFVNEMETELDFSDIGTEQILTIPLNLGLNKVEIIGVDLLIAPPSCVTLGQQYLFVPDLPGVKVDTWYDAVVIARDYLDNISHSNDNEMEVNRGGPIGSVQLVYLHENGTAFVVNRYDGTLEDVYSYFNHTPRESYFWIVTLNHEHVFEKPEYIFTIDAQTREVKEWLAMS